MRVTVDFAWREVGQIRVEAGRLRFPEVAETPGVYRFDLGDTIYLVRPIGFVADFSTTGHRASANQPTSASTRSCCAFLERGARSRCAR